MRQGGTLEEGDLLMKKVYVRVALLATSLAALLLAGGAGRGFKYPLASPVSEALPPLPSITRTPPKRIRMDRHRAQQVYCVALGLAACALAASLATQQPFPAILPLVLLGGLVAFAENQVVVLPDQSSTSGSLMLCIAAVVVFADTSSLLGPLLVGMCGGLYLPHLRSRQFDRVLFNVGNFGFTAFVAAVVFSAIAPGSDATTGELLLVSLPAALAADVANFAFVTIVVAFSSPTQLRAAV